MFWALIHLIYHVIFDILDNNLDSKILSTLHFLFRLILTFFATCVFTYIRDLNFLHQSHVNYKWMYVCVPWHLQNDLTWTNCINHFCPYPNCTQRRRHFSITNAFKPQSDTFWILSYSSLKDNLSSSKIKEQRINVTSAILEMCL